MTPDPGRGGSTVVRALLSDMAARCLPTQISLLEESLQPGSRRVQTVNLHHLFLAKKNPQFRRAVEEADAVTADGWPVSWALRRLGRPVDRVTGSDFVHDLLSEPRPGLRVALVGTSADVGDRFEQLLAARRAVLSYRLHSRVEHWDPAQVAADLTAAGTDVILVAVTPPHGDCFAARLADHGPLGTIIGVGGGVDMLIGHQVRAPRALQHVHLEWLFRMIRNPRRLGRRYLLECAPVLVRDLAPLAVRRQHPGGPDARS